MRMPSIPLYEIWFSTGSGMQPGPKFRSEQDALRYVEQHARDASYAIRCPDGHWEVKSRRMRPGHHGLPSRAPYAAR